MRSDTVVDHWVYKVYDCHLALIYVGVSRVGPHRLAEHARTSKWAPAAAFVLIEHYPSGAVALAREAALIRRFSPRFNITHKPPVVGPVAEGELCLDDAAVRVRFSTRLLKREIRAGRLAAYRGLHGYRIREDDLDAWVRRNPVRPVPIEGRGRS